MPEPEAVPKGYGAWSSLLPQENLLLSLSLHPLPQLWQKTGCRYSTLGPMLPTGPRSPLCPEHLQGTPQHVFSAMLSWQEKERSDLPNN